MMAALVDLELHVPAATSLKGKRAVVKALTAALRNSLNVSVAEIDHQDLWQRCTLGVAVAGTSEIGIRTVVQNVEKIVYREPRVELLRFEVEVVESEL